MPWDYHKKYIYTGGDIDTMNILAKLSFLQIAALSCLVLAKLSGLMAGVAIFIAFMDPSIKDIAAILVGLAILFLITCFALCGIDWYRTRRQINKQEQVDKIMSDPEARKLILQQLNK